MNFSHHFLSPWSILKQMKFKTSDLPFFFVGEEKRRVVRSKWKLSWEKILIKLTRDFLFQVHLKSQGVTGFYEGKLAINLNTPFSARLLFLFDYDRLYKGAENLN